MNQAFYLFMHPFNALFVNCYSLTAARRYDFLFKIND